MTEPSGPPISNGAPAQAARSPSPDPSMNTRPRTARRPDLVSTRRAEISRSAVLTMPAPRAWNRMLDPGFEQQGVGGDLVGGGVVGLGVDFPEHRVRRLQAAEGVDAAQQVIGETMHDLVDGAEPVGVQAAEIGDSRRRCPCRRGSRSAPPAGSRRPLGRLSRRRRYRRVRRRGRRRRSVPKTSVVRAGSVRCMAVSSNPCVDGKLFRNATEHGAGDFHVCRVLSHRRTGDASVSHPGPYGVGSRCQGPAHAECPSTAGRAVRCRGYGRAAASLCRRRPGRIPNPL